VKVNSGLLVRGLIPELRRRIVVNFAHQFYPALRIGIVDIGIKLTVNSPFNDRVRGPRRDIKEDGQRVVRIAEPWRPGATIGLLTCASTKLTA
jgi:hypothetical protein